MHFNFFQCTCTWNWCTTNTWCTTCTGKPMHMKLIHVILVLQNIGLKCSLYFLHVQYIEHNAWNFYPVFQRGFKYSWDFLCQRWRQSTIYNDNGRKLSIKILGLEGVSSEEQSPTIVQSPNSSLVGWIVRTLIKCVIIPLIKMFDSS